MFRKVLRTSMLWIVLATAAVQAQERVIADQVIAVVGNSMVLLSEVEDAAKQIIAQRREAGYTSDRDARHEALETLMLQKLLYNQALLDSLEISVADINSNVERMLEQEMVKHGSTQVMEQYYHKPIFEIRDALRSRFEESRYAQRMQQEVESKVTITPGEVERFYKRQSKDKLPIIPEQYVFAQITKLPPSTNDAKFRAKERLLEMRERIIKGTRFDVLARMYSVDHGSAVRGGEMDPMAREGFVKPFADALGKLSVGQVSGVVETEYGFHIIELLEKLPPNLYRCRHILLRPQFSDQEMKEAEVILDSAIMALKDSTMTFAEAAVKYSDDKYSKLNGGVVTNFEALEMYNAYDAKLATTRFLKEELPPDDFNQLRLLKKGEISRVYSTEDMRGNVLMKFIQLVDVIPSHEANLNEDYLRVEELALKEKKSKAFVEWLEKKVEGMYVRIDESFKNAEFENKFWIK